VFKIIILIVLINIIPLPISYYEDKVREGLRRECNVLYEDILALQVALGEPLYEERLFNVELEKYSKNKGNISWFRDRLERHKTALLDKVDRIERNEK